MRHPLHTFEPRTAAVMMPLGADGALEGVARSFPIVVEDGVLRLDLAGEGGRTVAAAIEVSR